MVNVVQVDQQGSWFVFSAGRWLNTFSVGDIHYLSEKLDFLWWFVY